MKKYFDYLEKNGGRLTKHATRTLWPDGSITDFVWQYAAGDICVLGAKTALDAIKQHMDAKVRTYVIKNFNETQPTKS